MSIAGTDIGRRSIVGLIVVLTAMLAVSSCGRPDRTQPETADRPRPDVLFILVDALRRDHVGLYGATASATPFLDELGARGTVFDDALSQAPQTLNSTASLFTSRAFPWLLRGVEHDPIPGVAPERRDQWARTPRLAAANLTVTEVLRDAGYQTVALFNNPHHHATSGFWQGFDEARLLPRDPDQAYARADSVRQAFLDWHAGRDPERPYFAYLHFMEPHNPYRPPDAYRKLFPPGPGRYSYTNGRPEPGFSAADLATMKALYNGEIRFLDDQLRELVGELERRDGLGTTLIVVTADHGEELMDHGGLGHGKTVELEQLRIPLLVAGGPVAPAAGRRIGSLVRNLDLAPTLVDLAGIDPPASFEGTSLLPLLSDPPVAPAPAAVSFAWIARLRSLTSAEWHCMRDLDRDLPVLYHRSVDPTGATDVAVDHPDLVELCLSTLDRLEQQHDESIARARELKAIEAGGAPDEGVREQLEALGYVE